MSEDNFVYRFKVSLHDIDAARIMFFAHLFRHAHDAYEAFMERIGFRLEQIIQEDRFRLPLVHAEADYRVPFRHGDAATVHVCPVKIGHSSFVLEYRFCDHVGELRASARTVHVHSATDGSAAAPLPDGLRAALTACLSDRPTDKRGS